ncbi:MAG: class I SAM-dependent methyltransferase [Alphaproteobacteria bacterium]|nr:class I SAM-dependent methyltransferase [Alphaproteobacteria bacterium]
MKKNEQLSTDAIKTLKYYDDNASTFIGETQKLNFDTLQKKFLSFIPVKSKILDFGCGAGRDSNYFINSGYFVTAIDGSPEMCKATEQLIHQKVICSTFQDFTPIEQYDGIWACASLLHLTTNELPPILSKLSNCLKNDGCFYISFKYGEYAGIYNDRYYTFMTENNFNQILQNLPNLEVIEYLKTTDIRPNRSEEWLNIFLKKI